MLPNGMRLDYHVVRPVGMSIPTYEQLRSHFRLLKLNERYRRMSLQHLGSLYPPLQRVYGADQSAERVAGELGTYADDQETVHGINHWRTVLYRRLSLTDEFCDGGFGVLNNDA